MIIYGILSIVFGLLQVLFSPLSLPDFPVEITEKLYDILDIISDALPLLWVYFDKPVVTVCLGVALALMAFEKLYEFIMWIVAKLPIGISKE